MPKNSSTSSFKRPAALLVACLVIGLAEGFLHIHADDLLDMSAVCIRSKIAQMRSGPMEDIVILGTSRSLAIDARLLQQSLGNRRTVFNYSLPDLGTTREFAWTLRRYLVERRHLPALILLAIPPEMFGGYQVYDDLSHLRGELFRRFFTPSFLWLHLAGPQKWELLRRIDARNYLPSYDLRNVLRVHWQHTHFAPWRLAAFIHRNREIVDRLERTNGQMLFDTGRPLQQARALAGLPPDEATFRATLRPCLSLQAFLSEAARYRIPTMLIDTPLPTPRYDRLAELGYFDVMERVVNQAQNAYPFFHYLPAPDSRYYECENFSDYSHLNRKGIERFNADFVQFFPRIASEVGLDTVSARTLDEPPDSSPTPDPQPADRAADIL